MYWKKKLHEINALCIVITVTGFPEWASIVIGGLIALFYVALVSTKIDIKVAISVEINDEKNHVNDNLILKHGKELGYTFLMLKGSNKDNASFQYSAFFSTEASRILFRMDLKAGRLIWLFFSELLLQERFDV